MTADLPLHCSVDVDMARAVADERDRRVRRMGDSEIAMDLKPIRSSWYPRWVWWCGFPTLGVLGVGW
jgi:hypothetical protein